MKRDQYWSKPKKVKSNGPEAWFYVSKGRIEIHIDSSPHVTLHIPRAQLVKYVEKST